MNIVYNMISTHAPAGGATLPRLEQLGIKYTNFYSRPCGRGDVIYARYSSAGQNISTHAPAGGATVARHSKAV